MHVTAKADYAVRAVVELAGSSQAEPRKVDDIAQAQSIPVSFLENILTQLRSSGVVRSQRGPEGGYWLARPAAEVDSDLEAERPEARDDGRLALAVGLGEQLEVVRAQDRVAEAVDRADERHHELVRRRLVQLARRAGLLDVAVVHDDDLLGDL